jgi:hypothetical protein
LNESKEIALAALPLHLREFADVSDKIWDFHYPIAHQPEKIKSISFKQKGDQWEGELFGIRGQYLITSVGVFNVRSHEGFMVDIEVK